MEKIRYSIYIFLSSLMFSFSTISFSQEEEEELEIIKTSTGHAVSESFLYESSEANTIIVTNKHGNIIIDTWEKDSIKMEYEINVGTFDEDLAKETLEQISVNEYITGKKLFVTTMFEEDFQSSFTFSINYHFHVPPDMKAEITSNFCDIYCNELQNYVQVKAEYGKLFLRNDSVRLTAAKIHLGFMDGNISNTDTVIFSLNNCNIDLRSIKKVSGITSFSVLNTDSVNTVDIKTNLDRITVSEVDSASITGEKTFCTVNNLKQTGHFEINTGGLNLSVAKTLTSLTVANEKANTELIIPSGMAYLLHGEVKQGRLTHYEQDELKVLRDVDTITFSGEFGSGAQTNIILFNKMSNLTIKQQ
jgi:hypothetical protein